MARGACDNRKSREASWGLQGYGQPLQETNLRMKANKVSRVGKLNRASFETQDIKAPQSSQNSSTTVVNITNTRAGASTIINEKPSWWFTGLDQNVVDGAGSLAPTTHHPHPPQRLKPTARAEAGLSRPTTRRDETNKNRTPESRIDVGVYRKNELATPVATQEVLLSFCLMGMLCQF
ncbi:hypothetical protein RRG08_000076 [Elysia crispata]|uniref:Uncharacterized protein n=1 Tax=Elysia crispata TaxID=231223 RepID=A0AAE1B7V6_9GAST|nr:hypothetical protein RRG08_000076 [Elysia crispata]